MVQQDLPSKVNRNESPSARRLRQVETHGYNGLALLTTYDGWRYFEPSDIDGFVPYELHRGTAVACGDPVCPETDLPRMMAGFAEYCAARRWRFTFVGASARVGKIANELGFHAVKIGEEPFFDLRTYSLSGKGAKKARSAVNLARRSGILAREYRDASPAIDSEIEEIAREWLDSRDAPAMGFLMRSRPFAQRAHKRIFVATHRGRVVGAMTCSPAPARDLLYVEEQVRGVDAPYGTSEILIDEARRLAEAEGYTLFSLGTSPLQGANAQPFGKFRLLGLVFKGINTKINFIYSFRSLNHFKKKFAPTFWEDNFFIYSGSLLLSAFAVITAFAPDGIPSLVLPKRMQWLRFVPSAALWTAALAGVFVTGFSAWEFPVLQLPVRFALHTLLFALRPADLALDRAMAHRLISTAVLLVAAAVAWQRRARA
jgi:phosphatidylglycerol lysyltransferase